MEGQKEESEEKFFHTENVGKNLVTTIIGCILMTISAVAICMNWFFEFKQVPIIQVSVVGAIGFLLLFARDKISSYLDIFIRKKIDK